MFRIRIQRFRRGIQSGSRILMTKNGKKFTALKKFDIVLIKSCNLPPKRTCKLQEKPSALKREYPALQNMKFQTFLYFISLGHFCPPNRFRIRNTGIYYRPFRISNFQPSSREFTFFKCVSLSFFFYFRAPVLFASGSQCS
jgi:hypothetical protein